MLALEVLEEVLEELQIYFQLHLLAEVAAEVTIMALVKAEDPVVEDLEMQVVVLETHLQYLQLKEKTEEAAAGCHQTEVAEAEVTQTLVPTEVVQLLEEMEQQVILQDQV